MRPRNTARVVPARSSPWGPKRRRKRTYVRLVAVDQTPLSSLTLRTVLARLVPPTCRLKRKCRPAQGYAASILRPCCSGDAFRTDPAGVCVVVCPIGHTSPAHPEPYACSRPCLLRSHETAPCAFWPPAERGGGGSIPLFERFHPLRVAFPTGTRHPKRGLRERVFQSLENQRGGGSQGSEEMRLIFPKSGKSGREFSNAWNKMFQALEIRL